MKKEFPLYYDQVFFRVLGKYAQAEKSGVFEIIMRWPQLGITTP